MQTVPSMTSAEWLKGYGKASLESIHRVSSCSLFSDMLDFVSTERSLDYARLNRTYCFEHKIEEIPALLAV